MPAFLLAAGLAFKDMLSSIAQVLLRILILGLILAALSGFLPSDPFRSAIVNAASAFQPFYSIVNFFIPVGFIVKVLVFMVIWDKFIYLYRLSIQALTSSDDVIKSA